MTVQRYELFRNKVHFGHFFFLFLKFVQRSSVCPHKFEKNLCFLLESAQNHRNFASEIRNKI